MVVDAGRHLAMLAKPLRGAFERALGGNAFGFKAADFLIRGLSFAQAVAGVRQLLRHLRDRRRIGDLAMTPAALGQFRKLLLQRAELGEAVGFRFAPMLQIVLGARERAVAARTALAVREVAQELGVDLIDGAPRAFAADERADFRFDGGVEQRRSAAAEDRRREGRALPDPKKPEGPFVNASAAAGADAEDVPDGFISFGEARDLAAVFGQDRRRRAQKALADHIALAAMLERELDGRRELAVVGPQIPDLLGLAVVAAKQAGANGLEEGGFADLVAGRQHVDARAEAVHTRGVGETADPFDAE